MGTTALRNRIVLIEDDDAYRDFLAREITAGDTADIVLQTGSESEAREWLQSNDGWDICVVDIFLKRGTGIALLSILRKRLPNQQVFVFSNYLSPFNKKITDNLNATRSFDKSSDAEALIFACSIVERVE